MSSSTPQPISNLRASPYHAELEEMQDEYRYMKSSALNEYRSLMHPYSERAREETRNGNTTQTAETQEKIDRATAMLVALHGQRLVQWDRVIERLAEDVGGRLGRLLAEINRDSGDGSENAWNLNLLELEREVLRRWEAQA